MFKKKKSHNGVDIDVRFLLANERTLLAWMRTGLTLIAGGVAVAFISNESHYGLVAGMGAIGFGGMLSVVGFTRYIMTDRAIREGKLPATGIGGVIVMLGVIIFAITLLILRELDS